MDSITENKLTELIKLTHNKIVMPHNIYHYTIMDNIEHIFKPDAL